MGTTMMTGLRSSTSVIEILTKLSAKFINMSAENVEGLILEAQRHICEVLELDRCALWQFSEDHQNLIATHVWSKRGDSVGKLMTVSEMFPWIGDRINKGETVVIPDVNALPAEASLDRKSLQEYFTKANVVIPLIVNSRVLGCVSFALLYSTRNWTDEEVSHLRLIAQMFANALDRKNKDQALLETQARLTMASISAGVGFWSVEQETGKFWATPRTRELLGLSPETKLSEETFYGSISPEERAGVRNYLDGIARSGETRIMDFRSVSGDGSTRWLSLRGKKAPEGFSCKGEVTGIMVDISERKKAEEELRTSLEEIKRLKDLLYAETDFLKAELVHFHHHPEIVGKSKAINNVLRQIRQVAGTHSTVLITGETGTGKELVARAVHALSERKDRVMVKVDCASLPSGLIESELFGRERGAYTGALAKQIGRFQLADKSTIFLDEIGELPLEVQAKLLRILESGEFEPLGSPKTIKVNVRVIAATNRDLEKLMREGRFREDLYFRLRVFPIDVPPLRERVEDIPLLAYNFIRKFSADMGKNICNIRKGELLALQQYSWPGNVRELRNLIEHAFITSPGDTLVLEPPAASPGRIGTSAPTTLAQTEEQHIRAILERTGWRIKGKKGAADLLGVKPSTLYAKMKKLGVPSRRQKDQIKS